MPDTAQRTKAPVLRRPLLDQKGASAYTGFSPRMFRRWIEEGTLPIAVVKVNGRNHYHPEDLDRLIDSFPRYTPSEGEEEPTPRQRNGKAASSTTRGRRKPTR